MNSIIRRFYRRTKTAPLTDIANAGDCDMRTPAHQNAVDLIPGWNHAFPEEHQINAGATVLYNDGRIHWAIEQFGSLSGKRVLELGPLEASHTSMLERCDPSVLDAVEANVAAYMRCLVAKQVYDLTRARFHLGNFVSWLEDDDRRYDFIVACGVLYHMDDPLHLLDLMSRRADAVYLWTHYFDAVAMPLHDPRRLAFSGQTRPARCGDLAVCLHARRYHGAEQNPNFCGGSSDLHYWMEKNAIIDVLRALGLTEVRTEHDTPEHPNGPAISIFARRSHRLSS
jgi:hypothetical protein